MSIRRRKTDTSADALRERRGCSGCGHSYTFLEAEIRSVPQPSSDGIPAFLLVPLCPRCKRPHLASVGRDFGKRADK